MAQGKIASTDGVFAFTLVPIAVALFGGWASVELDGLRLVPYGLLGVAGILILLPIRLPEGDSGLLGAGMLVVAMILTAACLILLGRLLLGLSFIGAVQVICLANGILLLLAAVFLERPEWNLSGLQIEAVRCLVIDLPETFLMLWLLKSVPPWRLSARYVIAPLFTILEGLWFVRPRFEVRTALGIAMLLASSALIVFAKPLKAQTGLNLT